MKEKDAPAELCLEVLRRLDKAGVLRQIILVGSWCVYFYPDFFKGGAGFSALRTRDMDFLIKTPPKITGNVDLADLLKDLGFIPDPQEESCVRLKHQALPTGWRAAVSRSLAAVDAQDIRTALTPAAS